MKLNRLIAYTLTIATSFFLLTAFVNERIVQGAQTDVKIPDTTAGKTFAAFLDALNSGDINKMKAFHTDRGGSEENADKDLGFYQQSGGLKVISVAASEEYMITVIAETKNEGMKVRFNMTVDSAAPNGITEIRVQPEQ